MAFSNRSIFAFLIIAVFVGFYIYASSQMPNQKAAQVLLAKNAAYDLYNQDDLGKIFKSLSHEGFEGGEAFEKQAFIESASFAKTLSGRPVIKVFLQEPVMAFHERGAYKLVDKTGAVFSDVPQYKIPDLPIMRGNLFQSKKNRARVVRVFLGLDTEGMLSQKSLSEVLLKDDVVFIFSGVKGRVFIGENDLSKKVDRLTKVIKYLRFHGLEAEVLDARFKDRVVVSLNKNKKNF